MSECEQSESIVTAALRRLGQEPVTTSLSSRLLAGGLSGSSVHSIELAGQAMVLKMTRPSEDRRLLERASQEVRFYRDLAKRVPVMIPDVLGFDVNETEGAILLLAAYTPSPPPHDWAEYQYREVVGELGRFHATFESQANRSRLPDWLRPKPRVMGAQCQHAVHLWTVLGEQQDLQRFLEPSLSKIASLVMGVPALDAQTISLPTTLCHGDCHASNLLRGPAGEWIWADWQDVRLGPGVDDLAFFWQRAFVAADTPPPYATMVRAYRAGLESVDGILIPHQHLERALAWSELSGWLVDWPGFLKALPTARVADVVQRIDSLIGQLELPDQR